MKKLIIIIAILGALVIANILINTDNSDAKKFNKTLLEAIDSTDLALSFEILVNGSKLKLVKRESCYEIQSIDYCADNKKVQLLKNFLNNDVEDMYENTSENLDRLGFNNINNKSSIVINDSKILSFGNINQYSKIYVLYSNIIYKVHYYKSILKTSSKDWIDKSSPIINTVESDEFNIMIHEKTEINPCAKIIHRDLISDKKFSTLRNSFFDLYASDVKKISISSYDEISKSNSLIKVYFENPYSKNIVNFFMIWREDHLVYFAERKSLILPSLAFVIPNSVYDNISIYCKK